MLVTLLRSTTRSDTFWLAVRSLTLHVRSGKYFNPSRARIDKWRTEVRERAFFNVVVTWRELDDLGRYPSKAKLES
jgi:hypothetical protein